MKTIKELIKNLNYQLVNDLDLNLSIKEVCVDSRKVTSNSLFICIKGESSDGHEFAHQAIENGALALVVQNELDIDIGQILVKDTKSAISKIAANYYGNPSKELNVIGITGTNGKTTSTYIIKHIFDSIGKKTGIIGTIGVYDGDKVYEASLTTPQPLEIQEYFYNMKNNKCDNVVMEVSSHALALSRVDDVDFNISAITNISQDHLDYHKSMDDYVKAKTKLFKMTNNWAIINYDDMEKDKFINATNSKILFYSCQKSLQDGLYAIINKANDQGTKFTLYFENKSYEIDTKLIGRFNVYNILLAIGVTLKSGLKIEDIIKAVNSFDSVPGRFEKVEGIEGFSVIVDYAHTPDALENVLKSAKALATNKLIVVFGCGGDRDRTKRPLMGNIAAKYGDLVIVTSDNPRTESPETIIEEIIKDIKGKIYVKIEIDRKEAIKKAIETASVGDVVLIAGKGHETYQIIGKEKHDFDDRVVSKRIYNEVK
jgi:UDP-N-acetylmuramoyl-L-alanyl-D-glutamate--2,6-diaminopimelate ligase